MSISDGFVRALAGCAVAIVASVAIGGPLTGQTLSGTGVFLTPSSAVVGAGVEFEIFNVMHVDFDENGLLVLTVHDTGSLTFADSFSYVFTDINNTIPDIAGFDVVSLGAGTTNFSQANLAFTANSFTFSPDGSTFVNSQANTLRLTFAAVPEPGSLALVSVALVAFAFARRRAS